MGQRRTLSLGTGGFLLAVVWSSFGHWKYTCWQQASLSTWHHMSTLMNAHPAVELGEKLWKHLTCGSDFQPRSARTPNLAQGK
jgi:hypothetical protein